MAEREEERAECDCNLFIYRRLLFACGGRSYETTETTTLDIDLVDIGSNTGYDHIHHSWTKSPPMVALDKVTAAYQLG